MASTLVVTRPNPGPGTQHIFSELTNLGMTPEWYFPGFSEPVPSSIILSRLRGDEMGIDIMLNGYSELVEMSPMETRVINPPHSVRVATSKQHQLSVYRAEGIPFPRTLRITPSTDLAQVAILLGLPMIIKKDVALEGQGVFFVGSLADLENLVAVCGERDLLAQTYIPEGTQTVNMIVIGKQVVASGRSIAGEGKWKTNAAEGGIWSGHYPSFREADLAIHVCEHVGLDIGEVEIVVTDRGPLVMDVDPSPHLTIVAQVAEINVAALIAQYCAEAYR